MPGHPETMETNQLPQEVLRNHLRSLKNTDPWRLHRGPDAAPVLWVVDWNNWWLTLEPGEAGTGLPVSRHVAHEQDAGVHVEVEGRAAKAAVEQAEGGGAAGVFGDPDRETEADEEVGGRQVLQVDGDAAGRLLSLAEVDLQGEAVEDESHLQRQRRDEDRIRLLGSPESLRLTTNTRL